MTIFAVIATAQPLHFHAVALRKMLRRVRSYAFITAVTMWSVLLIDFSNAGVRDRLGQVKGTDFLQFYAAGATVRDGQSETLYTFLAQFGRIEAVAGDGGDIYFVPVQSPQVALAFAPLARFSYLTALAIWIAISIGIYGLVCRMLWRRCPALHVYRAHVVACAVACPALYATVLHGQLSPVTLLFVTLGLIALQADRRVLAGLAFGCLAFKPHWVAAAGAIFFFAREWRVVMGIGVSAAAQFAVAALALGSSVILNYYSKVILAMPRIEHFLEPRASNTLKGFLTALVPVPSLATALYVIAAAVTVAATVHAWRKDAPFELRASAVLIAMMLISPHAFEYDLLLLVPAFFLLANWIATGATGRRAIILSRGLCALFVAPVLTTLPALIRLQFSVTAMGVILFLVWSWATERDAVATELALRPALEPPPSF
jgi:hypothetical protein